MPDPSLHATPTVAGTVCTEYVITKGQVERIYHGPWLMTGGKLETLGGDILILPSLLELFTVLGTNRASHGWAEWPRETFCYYSRFPAMTRILRGQYHFPSHVRFVNRLQAKKRERWAIRPSNRDRSRISHVMSSVRR